MKVKKWGGSILAETLSKKESNKTNGRLFIGKEQINFKLGSKMCEELEIIGRYLGMTKSEVVRQAVTEFIIDFDKKKVKPCGHR